MSISRGIEFDSGGITLRGVLHAPMHAPSVCVIISHGIAGYGDSPKWRFIASGLARSGFPTLRFSHSGCGDSDGDYAATTLTTRINEVRSAMDAMAEDFGARAFALIGASFGGASSIFCAADPRVKCLVVASTPAHFEFFSDLFPANNLAKDESFIVDGRKINRTILEDVKGYDLLAEVSRRSRILVLHGDSDELIPKSHAESIFAAAAEPKKLLIIPGADHPFSNEEHYAIMLDETIDWLQKYLRS